MGSSKDKLKVGLILDHTASSSVWVSRLINNINQSTYASIETILISNADLPPAGWKQKLYSLYSNLEKYRWSGTVEDDLWIQDLVQEEIEGTQADLNKPSDETLAQIKNSSLDVLLNLSRETISDQFSVSIKAGVWSLSHLHGKTKKQTFPIGFWEVYDKASTMESLLTTSSDQLLYRSVRNVNENSSPRLNQNEATWLGFTMVMKKLKQLHDFGLDSFLQTHDELIENEIINSNDFRTKEPGNVRMLYFFAKKFLNSLKMRVMNKLFVEEWGMRYQLADGLSMEFSQFKKLDPALGGLWADPFITYHNDAYYLFFEDAIYDQENADISVVRIGEDGSIGEIKHCLIRPYHLSYPFVFEWEGEHYMLPETRSNGTIEVYKATHFPDQWEFHSNLMEEIGAADTTLLFHNNKWWMFTNSSNYEGIKVDTELSIYYADSPLSQDWILHPMSPVVSDVRRARSAGRIFEHDGKLIRPSQDSSVRYGYGFRLNEIVTLTETEYEEREIDFIEPWEPMMLGTHTIAHAKNLTVIDVLSWRSKFF